MDMHLNPIPLLLRPLGGVPPRVYKDSDLPAFIVLNDPLDSMTY